jgi:hypothetical protein
MMLAQPANSTTASIRPHLLEQLLSLILDQLLHVGILAFMQHSLQIPCLHRADILKSQHSL